MLKDCEMGNIFSAVQFTVDVDRVDAGLFRSCRSNRTQANWYRPDESVMQVNMGLIER